MPKYLILIDGYGEFSTDSFELALERYYYFVENNIPVAMYERTQKFYGDENI